MKVGIYGCSFTHGVIATEDVGWPTEYAKRNPGAVIHDYSIPGSSLEYSVLMLEKYHKTYDINIFQVTFPNRITFALNEDMDYQKELVYCEDKLISKLPRKTQRQLFEFHDVHHKHPAIVEYVARRTKSASKLEHLALIEFAKRYADLVFGAWHYHNSSYYDETEAHQIPYLCDNWDADFRKSIKADYNEENGPGHFNQYGREAVAKWVDKTLRQKYNAKEAH